MTSAATRPKCLRASDVLFEFDPLLGRVTYLSNLQRSQMRQILGAHLCLDIACQ